MKLSDIFSLNLNSKGGAKLFKKIANKYNLDYKQVRKSVEENTDKYSYYKFNKDILPDDLNSEQFVLVLTELLRYVKYIELNGVSTFNNISGPCGFINTDALCAINLFQANDGAEFPYVSKEYFNLGFKICENDISFTVVKNNKIYTQVISGTIGERQDGLAIALIPITKEEYEHLSDDLKNIEVI